MKPMKPIGSGVVGAVAILLSGCAGGAAEPEGPAPEPGTAVTVQQVYAAGMAFGTTRDSIVRRLGQPRATSAEPEPNRHDASVTDTIRTLRYDDLVFTFLEAGGSGREFLIAVDATEGRPPLPGLAIGRSTTRRIVAVLGAPQHVDTLADTVSLAYTTRGPGAEDLVALLTVADTLRRVRWAPYVD